VDFLKILHRSYKQVVLYLCDFSVTNGQYIISGLEDQYSYLWDLQSNAKQKLEAYTDTVLFVSCHLVENKIAGS
jgi:WD40 repeat protein